MTARLPRKKWPIIAGAAVCLLLAGLAVLWAGGVFKVQTADGVLLVQVNEPNAEVFVDGDRVTVTWSDGGKKAEIHVKAGTRKVEVKKDGFSVDGKELTFKDGDREVFTARLLPEPRVAKADQPPPLAVAPFTDADVQRIAALPAAEQVEEVRKELMRRNPGFDGKMEHKIEDGVVTELRLNADRVTDISPIRVFDALRVLKCSGTPWQSETAPLADLTPLMGMNLAGSTQLDLSQTKVGDAELAPFKVCKHLRRSTFRARR